jgi:hypothetical protein
VSSQSEDLKRLPKDFKAHKLHIRHEGLFSLHAVRHGQKELSRLEQTPKNASLADGDCAPFESHIVINCVRQIQPGSEYGAQFPFT